jgi:hypothetical protein
MKLAGASTIFQDAVDTVVRENGEVGLQVAAYLDGNAVTAVALHLQAEWGLIDYDAPIVRYWPEFAANGKDQATIAMRSAIASAFRRCRQGSARTDERLQLDDRPVGSAKAAVHAEQPMAMCFTFGWVIAECVRPY